MMKTIIRLALAFALVALAVPANAACWQWSRTASSNATADPTINWSVGMAPSSVSASGRAMMARLAECRDDLSGSLVTGGTSTAYTLTTNQGIDNPPQDGQSLAFTVNSTNGNAPSLAVDGGTAYPMQIAAGTAAPAAILVSGTPYTVKFSNSASAWVLSGFFGAPFSVPLGAMLPYTGSTAPNSNFVLPAGQCISRTTYASYFALVGTRFGACDGTTTFAVPDMRGKTIAAIDTLGGTAANILTSTYFGADAQTVGTVGGSQSRTLTQTNVPSYNLSASGLTVSGTITVDIGGGGLYRVNKSSTTAAVGANGMARIDDIAPTTTFSLVAGGSIPSGGSSVPVATVQPTMVLTYILRVQ